MIYIHIAFHNIDSYLKIAHTYKKFMALLYFFPFGILYPKFKVRFVFAAHGASVWKLV